MNIIDDNIMEDVKESSKIILKYGDFYKLPEYSVFGCGILECRCCGNFMHVSNKKHKDDCEFEKARKIIEEL